MLGVNKAMPCSIHEEHSHIHGPSCGHTAVKHESHTDYLHDGHLHHVHESHVDEHKVSTSSVNQSKCTPEHSCGGHDATHVHGPHDLHEAVPHGDHVDYLVTGHLHHPHGKHCDDHGKLETAA